jgi:hypothetical protein
MPVASTEPDVLSHTSANSLVNAELSFSQLQQFALQLLACTAAGPTRQLIQPWLERLCQQVGLELHPPLFIDADATITAFGKAVSPTTAAQCAEDPERSRVFIQGIFAAISERLTKQPERPVQLLYAGTGPLGWLMLPLLALFSARQLQVTALDIHPQSLASFRQLASLFGVSDRICQWVCADATVWQPEAGDNFDVILSETMKHLLQQEPQVQIFTHLQQFLRAGGELLPQQINLAAMLQWQADAGLQTSLLGPLFSLNRQTAAQLATGDRSMLQGRLQLPQFEAGMVNLKLTTEIQVYQQHQLHQEQSQLTLSRYKTNLRLQPGSSLTFEYQQGEYPDFHFEFQTLPPELVSSADVCVIPLWHLQRCWQKVQLKMYRELPNNAYAEEWQLDRAVLDLAGIGLEPGLTALHQCHRLSDLQAFVQSRGLSEAQIQRINQQLQQLASGLQTASPLPAPLNAEQLAFWQQHGYLVVPGVLTAAQCAASRAAIWQYLQADPLQPTSWYQQGDKMKKIMLQLFRHPALDQNRQTPLIRQIFQQLWQRHDLVMSTDRVSFNPPETADWQFPGPEMHWDLPLTLPVPFGTQGMIYLTDTRAEQGAFCCVPGFHLQISDWLGQQPEKDPAQLQMQHWSDWPVQAIAAKAGDLIIWHHALPHGASANHADFPRMVQYINCYPLQMATEADDD